MIAEVTNTFKEQFNATPILVFSPGRINIIGEHTDYNNGFVFPAAVNKGIVAAIGKSNNTTSTIIALDVNSALTFSVDKIKPAEKGSWKNYVLGVVAEIKNYITTIGNFNVVFKGNIPSGAGMSSSAALENSIVFGLNELFNLGLTKQEMILISQKAEHNFVGVQCGIMDQYASMFGIKNNALLLDCKTLKATAFPINFDNHQLILINTNVKHSLSDSAYNERRTVCENIASLLGVESLREVSEEDLVGIKNKVSQEDYEKALYVIQEIERTQKAAIAMKNNDLICLGSLLYESHNGLQHQYKVSCEELDFLVELAKENENVLGARMMGGGFGGCTINLIEKSAVEDFTSSTIVAYKEKFKKDCSVYFVELSDGTHLINL